VATIPLTKALTGAAPSSEVDRLLVPVVDGAAVVDLGGPDPTVTITSSEVPPPPSQPNWVYSADGERRFATFPDGTVVAEHRRGSGFRREWRRTLPAPSVAAPLLVDGRLFVGALDAQVRSLQPENGHLLWSVDVADRVSRPIVLWRGSLPGSMAAGMIPVAVLLVVSQEGGTLLGLDPYDGRTLATFTLNAADGRFATDVTTTPDGRIAIGRETYGKTEADLLLLAVERAPDRETPADRAAAEQRVR
jgi:outer membrane protein assembly factor BamB